MNKDKSITSTMKENIKLYINKSWFKEYNKYKEKYIYIKKVLKDININPKFIKIEIREERKFNPNEDYYSKYDKYRNKYKEAKEKLHHIRRGTKPIKQALEELRQETKKELELLRKEIDLLKEEYNNKTKDLINTKKLNINNSVSINKIIEVVKPIKEEPASEIIISENKVIKEELESNKELVKNTIINKPKENTLGETVEINKDIKITNDLVDHELRNYNCEKINNKLIITNNFNKLYKISNKKFVETNQFSYYIFVIIANRFIIKEFIINKIILFK